MSGTSVPGISFGPNGFFMPQESAIVSGLNADWSSAFGGNLNTDPRTPAGLLIASQAAIIGDSNDQQVALYNGVDPAYATGRLQDAIGRIYFLTRNPALSTTLQVTCSGLQNVPIPLNALIEDPTGNIYYCTQAAIIGANGTVTTSFACQKTGPIALPNSVSIYQAVPGWSGVSLVSGVEGVAVESASAFEARREATVAANGAGFLPAILGAVLKVPGVINAVATENPTGTPITVRGVTLKAHSLYVAAAGGTAAAIAQAIWTKKNPGCDYNGNTTETVYDTNAAYSPPYPSYSVTFEIPTDFPVCFQVTLANNGSIPNTANVQIASAIASAFAGQDDGPAANIGNPIYAGRYYPGIASLGSWAQIISVFVGNFNAPSASFTGQIATNVLTVTAVASGALAVGQFVYGSGVLGGSYIIALGSGTGGTGTYILASTQNVSSEAMLSVTPSQLDTQVNLDQLPTFNNADVNIILM